MKPVILYTSNNIASKNIADKLVMEHGFEPSGKDEWIKKGVKLIDTRAPHILEIPTEFFADYLLVLSTHKSKNPDKMLTAHIPGNWGKAEMGGTDRTLNIAASSRLKIIFQEVAKEAKRIGWKSSLEADHHGPNCEVPIIFVEIGTTEEEWQDETAGRAIANAVDSSLLREETFEPVFAVGEGHYPKTFSKLELESPLAMGHMLPKYAIDGLDDPMFDQAIRRSVEKTSRVIIAKDGVSAAQREKIKEMAKSRGIAVDLV